MAEVLEDGDFSSQLTLVLVREPQFVNHLHCYQTRAVSVLT